MQGFCHSAETFGAVDGPGLRYVLFMAGCKLGCAFCHNPDTWAQGGIRVSVAEVLDKIERYRGFYEASGGGITVSGGEPLLQAEFVAELFKDCKSQGIHTVLDTAGFAPRPKLETVLPWADQILFSLKTADSTAHEQLTAAGNAEIVANLRYAAAAASLIVRYVIIPGINDREPDLAALASLLHTLPNPVKVELLPYHTLGRHKWEALGLSYKLAAVPAAGPEEVRRAKQLLEENGISVL